MFVSKAVLEILTRENDRLSQELKRKDEVILELIDRYTHNRVPQRLIQDQKTIFNSPTTTTSLPSDAYSQAIEDAERLAEKAPTFDSYIDDDDD